jgi:hypothetical protein
MHIECKRALFSGFWIYGDKSGANGWDVIVGCNIDISHLCFSKETVIFSAMSFE